MSSIFFRPIPPRELSEHVNGALLKWNGTSEMWARCQLCCWSGPFGHFTILQRGEEVGMICDGEGCWSAASTRLQLENDGWTCQ